MAAAGSSSYSGNDIDTVRSAEEEEENSIVVIDVPRKKLSNIIGCNSKGEYLEYLKEKSGASIVIKNFNETTSKVQVSGNKEQVHEAERLIREAIADFAVTDPNKGPFLPPMQIPRDL